LDFLTPHRPKLYAVMRIAAGILFVFHGSQKLFGWPMAAMEGMPAFITYVAGPIELVGGLLLVVGLMVRPAAFLCSGLMAAAYWMGHGTKAVLPILNGGELAFVLCFVFLFIAAEGAGIWSIDERGGDGA